MAYIIFGAREKLVEQKKFGAIEKSCANQAMKNSTI